MRKKIVATLLALVLVLSCLPMYAFAETYGSADKARNSVARVVVTGRLSYLDAKENVTAVYEGVTLGSGSCFAIGEKGKPVSYFVTSSHVVSTETEVRIVDGEEALVLLEPQDFYIVMDNEENMHPCTVVTNNPGGADLAVLMLREPTTKREAIYLAPYSNPQKVRNQPVYSVGFPGSSDIFLDVKQAYSSGPDLVSVRQGLLDHEVTSVQSGGLGTLLLTDVAITPGNSGGPLVNAKGAVLGICAMGADSDSSMNAAVSVNELVSLLKKLNLPYMTEKTVDWLTIALCVVAAALIVTVVVLLLKKNGKKPSKNAYRLQGLTGVYAGKRYALEKDLRIGRDPSRNDLAFPSSNKKISGAHCTILVRDNELFVQDNGSTNGTYINDQRLESGQTRKLLVGDVIALADKENTFRIDVSSK